jgi:competence protein ComGC
MFRKKRNNDLIFLIILVISILGVFFISNQKVSSVRGNFKSSNAIESEFNDNFTSYSIQQPDKNHYLLNLLADEVFETEQEESKEKLKKLSDNSLTCFSCCTISCLFLKRNLNTWFLNKTTNFSKPPLYTLYNCRKYFLHSF